MKEDTQKILLHTAILAALTVPFWFFNIDIKALSFFYDFNAKMWKYAGSLPVKLLYDFGVYPAIIMTGIAAVVFGLGFTYKKMEKHRKISLLIMLALFIGPAVTINVLLKNYSGRPRPREIKEFNGRADFRNILQPGTPGRGHSFPCGHASMGFLFSALYFAFRDKNKPAAYAAMAGGLLYGSALGVVRMAQGAHFLSDVLWAGGITLIGAEIAWTMVLGGEGKSVFDSIKAEKSGQKTSVAVIFSLLAALIIIFLFSVPYARERYFTVGPVSGTLELDMDIEGDLRIIRQDAAEAIVMKATGFGFPKRQFEAELGHEKTAEGDKYTFRTIKNGLFAELNSTVDVYLPKAQKYVIKVNDSKGDIECTLPGDAPLVMLSAKNGDIVFTAGGEVKEVFLRSAKGGAEAVFEPGAKLSDGAFIDVNVKGGFGLDNKSPYFRELGQDREKVTGSKELYFKSVKKAGPSMSVKAGKIIIR